MNSKGKPMTEEEIKDWQKGFTDVEDSIAELYKKDKEIKNERMRNNTAINTKKD